MTDFLTRMACSALGLTPVAKVLAASRYAPGPDLPEQAPEEMPEQKTISPETLELHAAEAQPARTAEAVVRRKATVAAQTPDATLVASTPLARQERLRDANRREGPARLERELRPPAPADQPIDAGPPPSRRAIASSREVDRPRSEPAQPIDAVEVTERSAVSLAEAVAAPWSRPSHSSPLPIELPEPRHAHASSPPVDVWLEHAPSPRTLGSPLPVRRDESGTATPAATPAATPVIRVTIGRVEVRGMTPPPPAEPPRPAAPRMSLDDYLRSYKGRTR
jgi:hypothetical protein